MGRLIDADALIKELEKDEDKFDKEAEDCRRNSRNYTNDYLCEVMGRADGIRDAIIEIYDAPTIEARPKGEWIYQFRDSENEEYRCSVCGFPQGFKPNFCPNCGARMDGERKETDYE